MNVTALILAAGSGSRMKSEKTKQRIELCGKTVLFRAVSAFEQCALVDAIVVVVRSDELQFAHGELSSFSKVKKIVIGGKTRLESAKIGFDSIDWKFNYVAIHDAARCFITPDIIDSVLSDAKKYGAATASSVITDTVKKITDSGNIEQTIDRKNLVCAQTPQIFKKELYEKAINSVDLNDVTVTDDNMLLERIGIPVHCTETGKCNIKITVPEDLFIAEYLLNGDF